jgi:hypothetical protein
LSTAFRCADFPLFRSGANRRLPHFGAKPCRMHPNSRSKAPNPSDIAPTQQTNKFAWRACWLPQTKNSEPQTLNTRPSAPNSKHSTLPSTWCCYLFKLWKKRSAAGAIPWHPSIWTPRLNPRPFDMLTLPLGHRPAPAKRKPIVAALPNTPCSYLRQTTQYRYHPSSPQGSPECATPAHSEAPQPSITDV